MRWHKHTRGIVSSVRPGDPVHVWIDGAVATESRVEVFQVAETAVRRALRRLGRSPGIFITDLPLDPQGRVPAGSGMLTLDWKATQRLSNSLRPSTYVASFERRGTSGPLDVFTEVSVSTIATGREFKLDVDAATLGLPAGLPLPSVAVGSGRHDVSMTGVVRATQDPEVGVRVITRSSPDLRLDAYLRDYLVAVAEAFDVPAGDLDSAFREANGEWLVDPVEIEATVQPSEIHVDAGETVPIVVDLYPQGSAGSTMLALAVTRPGPGAEILGVSELVGLTVTEEGFVFRDF
jgi:hypothetical protein